MNHASSIILLPSCECWTLRNASQRHSSTGAQNGKFVHMDDIYVCGEAWSIRDSVAGLGDEGYFKGGDMTDIGKPYHHWKRLQTKIVMELRPNRHYLECVLDALKGTDANDAPTLGVPGHRARNNA